MYDGRFAKTILAMAHSAPGVDAATAAARLSLFVCDNQWRSTTWHNFLKPLAGAAWLGATAASHCSRTSASLDFAFQHT
jgi:hypothetical protein